MNKTIFEKVLIKDKHVNTIRLCYNSFGHESYGRIMSNRKEFYCKDEEYYKKHDSFPIVTHTLEEIQLDDSKELTLEEKIFNLIEPILSFYCNKDISVAQTSYKNDLNQWILETRFRIAYGKIRFIFTKNLKTKTIVLVAKNSDDTMIRVDNLVFDEEYLFDYLKGKHLKKI